MTWNETRRRRRAAASKARIAAFIACIEDGRRRFKETYRYA